ncbi:MAG: hypothetical protein C4324_03415 [Blastocatellia bacterium]
MKFLIAVKIILTLILAFSFAAANFAQTPPQLPPPKPLPRQAISAERPANYEKAIPTSATVNLKFCVSEGEVQLNGWGRDEIRVFVRNGREPMMKTLERDPKSEKAAWLLIGSQTDRDAVGSNCLAAQTIELDVPYAASVDISGRSAGIVIHAVRRAKVTIVEGSLRLRNLSAGVTAEVFQGDILVEASGGPIWLRSSTGNITAIDLKPGETGDEFHAKTNSGAISMQRVIHRQIEAGSIFGSVVFDGRFLPGGLYDFKTTNGSVRLRIPLATSGTIAAAYGFGSFQSDIPYKLLAENNTGGGRSIVVQFGTGDATVNITTASGSIAIERGQ